MQEQLISIVLPTFNGSKFVSSSIESCLKQSYSNFELIIVNDASTDDTENIIRSYAQKDDRIRVITNTQNMKLPASLNIGFSSARGKYFTWTSDDNSYNEDALSVMVNFLEKNSSAGLVYCDYNTIDINGKITGTVSVTSPKDLAYRNCIGCCFLYRADVLKLVGPYSEAKFLAEDYDYWLRVSTRFQLVPLHTTLYNYRYHSGSLTSTKIAAVREKTYDVLVENLPKMNWLSDIDRGNGYIKLWCYCVSRARFTDGFHQFMVASKYLGLIGAAFSAAKEYCNYRRNK